MSPLRVFRRVFSSHGAPRFVLTAHLFRRFFDNEFVAESGDSVMGVVKVLILLAMPVVFYTCLFYGPYDWIAQIDPTLYEPFSMRNQFGYVCLAMVVVGLVTILEWDALFLDRLDFLTLVPLPLEVRRIFGAKIAALLLFLLLITLAAGAPGAILFPLVASVARHVGFWGLCLWMLVHGLSVAAASAFIFLCFVALQGVLLLLPSRRYFERLSPYVQGALIAVLLVLALRLPQIDQDIPSLLSAQGMLVRLLPPVWFLGLYRVMLGYTDPVYFFLARRALEGLGWVTGISILTYAVNYRWHFKRRVDFAQGPASNPWRLSRGFRRMAGTVFLRRPLERATFAFVFGTLRGSERHRLLLSAYAGVGAALVLESLAALLTRGAATASDRMAILLSVPLLLSFFLLSGLRMVFEIPADTEANWVFQLTERRTSPALISGVRKALVVAATVPILTLALPIYALRLSFGEAVALFLLDFLLVLLLAEVMLLRFQKIPFTCSFNPAQYRSIIVWGVCWWAVFTSYAYGLAKAEEWVLHHPIPLAVFVAFLVGGLCWLRIYNRQGLAEAPPLLYAEEREPVVQTLDLSHCALEREAES